MKGKLILKHRGDYDYFLLSRTENSEAVQASLIPDDEFEQKLSKQNCDEIFGVVDVEELAKNYLDSRHDNEDIAHPELYEEYGSFVKGFNKAMGLNKDKVFTLEDMEKGIDMCIELMNNKGSEFRTHKQAIIQSLQQPDEIEVEIEMKFMLIGQCNCECHKPNSNIIHFMPCCNPRSIEEPKLDENGCLILKRI